MGDQGCLKEEPWVVWMIQDASKGSGCFEKKRLQGVSGASGVFGRFLLNFQKRFYESFPGHF